MADPEDLLDVFRYLHARNGMAVHLVTLLKYWHGGIGEFSLALDALSNQGLIKIEDDAATLSERGWTAYT